MFKIYTDGSCIGNPGKGGWAAIILNEGKKEITWILQFKKKIIFLTQLINTYWIKKMLKLKVNENWRT